MVAFSITVVVLILVMELTRDETHEGDEMNVEARSSNPLLSNSRSFNPRTFDPRSFNPLSSAPMPSEPIPFKPISFEHSILRNFSSHTYPPTRLYVIITSGAFDEEPCWFDQLSSQAIEKKDTISAVVVYRWRAANASAKDIIASSGTIAHPLVKYLLEQLAIGGVRWRSDVHVVTLGGYSAPVAAAMAKGMGKITLYIKTLLLDPWSPLYFPDRMTRKRVVDIVSRSHTAARLVAVITTGNDTMFDIAASNAVPDSLGQPSNLYYNILVNTNLPPFITPLGPQERHVLAVALWMHGMRHTGMGGFTAKITPCWGRPDRCVKKLNKGLFDWDGPEGTYFGNAYLEFPWNREQFMINLCS